MVAADYSERRRGLASAVGLGRQKGGAEAALTQQAARVGVDA
jgi:predicted transcriptional regulator